MFRARIINFKLEQNKTGQKLTLQNPFKTKGFNFRQSTQLRIKSKHKERLEKRERERTEMLVRARSHKVL